MGHAFLPMITRTIACSVVVAALSAPFAGWAASLNDELVFLLTQHPRIKSAQRDVLGADQGVRGAVAGYYPQLSIDANYGEEYTDSPSRRLTNQRPSKLWRDTRGIT